MRTQTELSNQQAINEFFEGYGPDTAKEYSSSIVDLLLLVADNNNFSREYREDLTTKLKDLNRLVLQLGKTDKIPLPILESDYQKN